MSSIKQGFLLILTMLIVAIGAFVWLSRDVVNIDWTPDGEWILFYCGYFGYTDPYSYLYITRPDGTEFQRISTQQFIATSPSWSPNGDWIAFINGTYGQDIYIMRPDGSEIRKLAEFSNMYRITSLVWSSQDEWVIYGINGGIFDPVTRIQMLNINTQETRTLHETEDYIQSFRMSPDGNYLAFVSVAGQATSGIHVLDLQNGVSEWVYHRQGIIGAIDWSGDGRGFWADLIDRGNINLWHIALENSGLQQIKANPFYSSPEESPDGKFVAFYGYDDTGGHLFKVSVADESLHQITHDLLTGTACGSIDWQSFDN